MLPFKSSWYRDLVELLFKMWWKAFMIQFLFSPYTRYYPSTPQSLNNLHLRSLPGSLIWWIFDKMPAVVLLYLLQNVFDIYITKARTNRNGDKCNTTWKLWGRCVAGVVVPDVLGRALSLTQSDVMLLWETNFDSKPKTRILRVFVWQISLSLAFFVQGHLWRQRTNKQLIWWREVGIFTRWFCKQTRHSRKVSESLSKLGWFV